MYTIMFASDGEKERGRRLVEPTKMHMKEIKSIVGLIKQNKTRSEHVEYARYLFSLNYIIRGAAIGWETSTLSLYCVCERGRICVGARSHL